MPVEMPMTPILWLLSLLVSIIGALLGLVAYFGKKALDNNTEAVRELVHKLDVYDSRLRLVESDQKSHKAVCDMRHDYHV
jgi:hypothetical protein